MKKMDIGNTEEYLRLPGFDSSAATGPLCLLRKLLSMLEPRRKRQLRLLCFAMVLCSAMEAVALGGVAVFASAVAAPDQVLRSGYIVLLRRVVTYEPLYTPQGIIVGLSLLVVLLMAGKNLLRGLTVYAMARFASLIDGFFGVKLMRGFLHLPIQWHSARNPADLIIALDWRTAFGTQFLSSSLQVVTDSLFVAFMVVAIVVAQPLIGPAIIVLLGLLAFLAFARIRRILDNVAKVWSDYKISMNRKLHKTVNGIRDAKIAGREECFVQSFAEGVSPLARYAGLQQVYTLLPTLVMEVAGFVMLTGCIIVLLFVMRASTAQAVGTIALITVTAWRVLPAVARILNGLGNIRGAAPYLARGMYYLDEIREHGGQEAKRASEERLSLKREIQLQDAEFRYAGGKAVLSGVTFQVRKGESVGILGRSGAGKSTLVDVLMGLLPLSAGTLLVDGEELALERLVSWRKAVGYVPQFPYFFDGTIAENIAFGLPQDQIDYERVEQCCRMAAMDFLAELPSGVHSWLGERGVRLSGGQRQRVSIARALYSRPDILILDEATSSLDAENERAVQETINALRGRQTLIVVAHRLSTLSDCDRLVWLQEGRVLMEGTPADVLPVYENLGEGLMDTREEQPTDKERANERF